MNCHADPDVCRQLKPQSAILFYQAGQFPLDESYAINTMNPKEIVAQILGLLPDLDLINEEQFHVSFLKISQREKRLNRSFRTYELI